MKTPPSYFAFIKRARPALHDNWSLLRFIAFYAKLGIWGWGRGWLDRERKSEDIAKRQKRRKCKRAMIASTYFPHLLEIIQSHKSWYFDVVILFLLTINIDVDKDQRYSYGYKTIFQVSRYFPNFCFRNSENWNRLRFLDRGHFR